MVRIAVCDDEPSMREDLSSRLLGYLEKEGLDCEVSQFPGGTELLGGGLSYDVLFLDIQMGPPDGMETARCLRARGFCGLLVFLTVLREYVFDAFSVEAYDYLVKPLDDARFQKLMGRIMKKLTDDADRRILMERDGVCEVIPFSEIVYCEVLGRKLYLHQSDGTVVECYGRLAGLERKLDGRFFKCHRSYLVNLDFVRGTGGGSIRLEKGGRIPLSRLREREFRQALLNHMDRRR